MSQVLNEKRILCFGDSLTEGWYNGGKRYHPYTIRLSELFTQQAGNDASPRPSVAVVNKGISGEVVNPEMMNRLPKILREEGPFDLVIILGGTNDLACLRAAKEYNLSKGINSLHQLALKEGFKTCAVTIPQTGFDLLPYAAEYVAYREQVNDKIREFVAENSRMICLCDLSLKHPMYGLGDKKFVEVWDDELHFTPKGYDKMAEIIFEDIKNFI